MSRLTFLTLALVLLLGVGLGETARAAELPSQSLLQIFNRVPKAPATTQEADKMVNAKQQMPVLVAIRSELDAHSAAVEKIFAAADAKIRARMGGAANPEQAAQAATRAASVAGIDVARMQTDKAYAAEMQAKMRSMTPQEMMAMSAALSQGMGMRATVAVYDPPAVKAAAEAGQALMQPDQVASRSAVYQRRWAEVDRKVTAIQARYQARFPKMQLGCDGEGGGRPECQAERARFVSTMMPLLYTRDAEILQVEAAAVEEERAALAAQVRTADAHLLAAQYGGLSQELGNPTQIGYLDMIYVGEIKALVVKFEELTKRAAYITHCGTSYLVSSTCYGQQ